MAWRAALINHTARAQNLTCTLDRNGYFYTMAEDKQKPVKAVLASIFLVPLYTVMLRRIGALATNVSASPLAEETDTAAAR